MIKEIQNFNTDKSLKRIKKINDSRYELIEFFYNENLKFLNRNFYIDEGNYLMLLEMFEENFIDIKSLHHVIVEESEDLNLFYEDVLTYINVVSEEDLKKMCDFILKALELNARTLSKLNSLAKLNVNTIIFMKKYLLKYEFRTFCNEDIKVFPIYAKSVNDLRKVAEEYKMKLTDKVKPVFNRAKTLKRIENAFILVTQEELDSIKGYNYVLREPVNFPLWEIDHFQDITFKDGKGEGIFTEFTKTL